MNIEIIKCLYSQIADQYPQIHNEVFDSMSPGHQPAVVYMLFEHAPGEERGPYIGFLSGYYHDAYTLYIQRMGVPRMRRGKQGVFGVMRAVTDRLREEGLLYVLAKVENTNRAALLIALRDGWVVNGVQMSTGGTLYLNLIKELRDIQDSKFKIQS